MKVLHSASLELIRGKYPFFNTPPTVAGILNSFHSAHSFVNDQHHNILSFYHFNYGQLKNKIECSML